MGMDGRLGVKGGVLRRRWDGGKGRDGRKGMKGADGSFYAFRSAGYMELGWRVYIGTTYVWMGAGKAYGC